MTDSTTAAHARPNWQAVRTYEDIRFERDGGLAKITICRPEVRNAFRPKTLFELIDAFSRAREDGTIGVIIFTGEAAVALEADVLVAAHGLPVRRRLRRLASISHETISWTEGEEMDGTRDVLQLWFRRSKTVELEAKTEVWRLNPELQVPPPRQRKCRSR